VLLDEVVDALKPRDGARYIDATFGAGGYSRALLDAADCHVLALDRDEAAVRAADAITPQYANRLEVVCAPFSQMAEVARVFVNRDGESKPVFVQGVMFDVGVSSMQIDQPERGFSFQVDGPLDMRMGQSGPTAADIVNTWREAAIADVLYHYGEERRARPIARAIVQRRAERPFLRTLDLAGLVQRVLKTPKIDGRHAATRTFQALRIAVNDELGELAMGLSAAETLLAPGGRLAVVTFHSLEDVIVKRFLRARSGREAGTSRHLPAAQESDVTPSFAVSPGKPIVPSDDEIASNPRARSARLRTAIRTDAPPHAIDRMALGLVEISP
jgi:16S rRNA (cytosine1402-N4)-methyltransferase